MRRIIFDQLMNFVPWQRFQTCVKHYEGDLKTYALSTEEFFKIMAFAQISGRESLAETVACLNAVPWHLHQIGLPGPLVRSNIAHANHHRDWRIFRDFAKILIEQPRELFQTDQADSHRFSLDACVYALDSTTVDLCMSLLHQREYERELAELKVQIDGLKAMRGDQTLQPHIDTLIANLEIKVKRLHNRLSNLNLPALDDTFKSPLKIDPKPIEDEAERRAIEKITKELIDDYYDSEHLPGWLKSQGYSDSFDYYQKEDEFEDEFMVSFDELDDPQNPESRRALIDSTVEKSNMERLKMKVESIVRQKGAFLDRAKTELGLVVDEYIRGRINQRLHDDHLPVPNNRKFAFIFNNSGISKWFDSIRKKSAKGIWRSRWSRSIIMSVGQRHKKPKGSTLFVLWNMLTVISIFFMPVETARSNWTGRN